MAYQDEQIPRTHNLYELLKSCANYFAEIIIDLEEQADRLTNYAVITRYPNDEIDVEKTDMEQAMKDAEHILSYVTALFAADYSREYAVDELRLFRFLEDTQPEEMKKIGIPGSDISRNHH